MNPFEKQKQLPGIRNVVAISSGKGGVGKSTVSSQLAVAFAKRGARVGLLDADIYGPSQPRMFGALNQKPAVTQNQRILPIHRFGVNLMSMGFLVDEGAAIVWRGPMLFKAMDQLLGDVEWGELDYLFIDLPPGTGDVQLSLVQKVALRGAVAVTTPQNVALADVKKSIDMFQRVNVPILGVVENMSYFRGPNGEKLEIFPRGQIDSYMKLQNLDSLGAIPFDPDLSRAVEAGIPILESQPSSLAGRAISEIAENLEKKLRG